MIRFSNNGFDSIDIIISRSRRAAPLNCTSCVFDVLFCLENASDGDRVLLKSVFLS